jgi:FMN-dependent NADH-azoreductase
VSRYYCSTGYLSALKIIALRAIKNKKKSHEIQEVKMKVLVLNGSPKKQSDTMQLTSSFLNGLNDNNEQEIKVVSVIEKNIEFCQGCLKCWIKQDGYCVLQDDMNGLLDEIKSSDIIIWSFPLYYYGFPAHLKAVIDRTNPLMKITMKQEGNRVIHEKVVDMSAKNNIVISGGGFPYFEDNFAPLRLQCKNIFDNLTMVCVFEVPLMNAPNTESLKNPLLDKFKEAGKEYISNGNLSESTIKVLETPMLPNEVYINVINGFAK